jgi:hypothetical protein
VNSYLSDFPGDALAAHGIEGRHPDDFCCELLNTSHRPFPGSGPTPTTELENPPRDVPEFLANLQVIGLPKMAARLRLFADSI